MAMSYSNLFRIPSLSGDNYHTWSVRAKATLIREETWHAIEPGFALAVPDLTGNDKKANDKALSLIFSIIDDTFLDDVGQCVCAREAWLILEELNTKHGLLHILQLMRELFNVRMKTGESMKDYLGRLMEIHRKLAKCGYGYNDKELACMMLLGLPESYEQLILSLEHHEDDLNTKEVKAKLLLEEKRKASREDAHDVEDDAKVLFTKKDKPKGSKGRQQVGYHKRSGTKPMAVEKCGTSRVRRNTKCYDCLEFGHIARECPLRANAEDDVTKTESARKAKRVAKMMPQRALCGTPHRKSDPSIWYLDSGCTDHMTSSRSKLMNFRRISSSIEVANGEKLDVAGMGTVELAVKPKNGGCTVTLADVLYAPGLDGNLLSVGRIEEKGMDISFHDGKATITDNGEAFIWTTREGRLYGIEEEQCAKVVKHVDTDLWHRRLGHLHMEAVRKLHGIADTTADVDAVAADVDTEVGNCTTCMRSKLRRKKFPKMSDTRATEVLGLIHSDVIGPITPTSKGGSKYAVTFIDDCSRQTKIYFMKKKSEVIEKFKEFKEITENFHGKKIKILRSDNGGEYRSEEFDAYILKHGIRRQLTVPRTPQQNGSLSE